MELRRGGRAPMTATVAVPVRAVTDNGLVWWASHRGPVLVRRAPHSPALAAPATLVGWYPLNRGAADKPNAPYLVRTARARKSGSALVRWSTGRRCRLPYAQLAALVVNVPERTDTVTLIPGTLAREDLALLSALDDTEPRRTRSLGQPESGLAAFLPELPAQRSSRLSHLVDLGLVAKTDTGGSRPHALWRRTEHGTEVLTAWRTR